MKILEQELDFRGWETFDVIGDENEIRQYFQNQYPNDDVCVHTLFNMNNRFQVTILPIDEYELIDTSK